MVKIKLKVNGNKVEKEVADNTLLVSFIRENLNLTGTHVGCDTSQCGSCVVHVDGKSIKSCTMLVADANGAEVTTIEGLEKDGNLQRLGKLVNHRFQRRKDEGSASNWANSRF